MLIDELTLPLDRLKGLGSESAKAFAQLGVFSLGDLLLCYPRAYEDRSTFYPLSRALDFESIACVVQVTAHDFLDYRGEKVLKVFVQDGTAEAVLVCYGRSFLQQTLTVGQKFFLYGSFQYRYNQLQCSSFEVEVESDQSEHFKKILPIYPLSGSLTQGKVRKMIKQAFDLCSVQIDSLLPEELWRSYDIEPDKKQWLHHMHWPADWKQYDTVRTILVMEELFLFHLGLVWRRAQVQQKTRVPYPISLQYLQSAKLRLPFVLTKDQNQAIDEILQDLQLEFPMRRLLQGDVGTGKTLVALLASCPLFELNKQVVLMAPTELLARQHANHAAKLLEPLGVRVAFLTSNIRSNQRKQVLQHVAQGDIHLVVGTHALFSADIEYADLALVIIDEQHRFGVMQRQKLLAKGRNPDLLLMTATPIPRTLALTAFGDLDCSQLRNYPEGRLPIRTHLVSTPNIGKVHHFVDQQLHAGYQAYYIYPMIEEREQADLKNAEAMYLELKTKIFPQYKIGLIHARLDEEEKRKTMAAFSAGQIDILVATTVVEVGVDVPNATVMVIEGSEHFGLAALHQLRGRVGRGKAQGYCFLVYNELSEEGKQRLRILYENSDGFMIANEDLKLRGPGEFSGYRQSGLVHFRLAELDHDAEIFDNMRTVAQQAFDHRENQPKLLHYLERLKQKMGESLC